MAFWAMRWAWAKQCVPSHKHALWPSWSVLPHYLRASVHAPSTMRRLPIPSPQVQSIAMLAHLTEQGVQGPFMVVGPLSTLHNWANEFKKWTPDMSAVVYHGSKQERKDLRGTHWRSKGTSADMIAPLAPASAAAAEASDRWWQDLPVDVCDPITLEPIRALPYPPFAFERTTGAETQHPQHQQQSR